MASKALQLTVSTRAVATTALLLFAAACAPAAPGPPNIIVLSADDLGYGDLPSYGHPTIRTPNIDRLVEEGVRFTSFYAGAPSCTPSRASLLTGRYAVRVGLPHVLMPESEGGLPTDETTIAEALKSRGYRTAAVGKWHLGHTKPEHFPTAHGFDRYLGLPYSNDMIRPWVQTDMPLRMYRDDAPIEGEVDQSTLTTQYTAEAVRFIDEDVEGPFFLYLAYSMPHLPIYPSAERDGQSRAGRYGDVIETLDWSVGQILEALEARGIEDETLVVFTSDNGPWLHLPDRMLQDGNLPWHAGSTGLLRGAKATTYEGGLRVPTIFRWPGKLAGGRTYPDLASQLDLYPTLLAAADAHRSHPSGVSGADPISDASGPSLDGENLMPWLNGEPMPERAFYYFRGETLEAVRVGRWKYRLSRQTDSVTMLPSGTDTPEELFDLELDPSEQYNVAGEHPDVVDRLRERMGDFMASTDAQVRVEQN